MTLTGPPGVGKSRLAVEAARSLEHEFPDGIWLVDFARAGGAADAVRLLAHVVDVRGSDPLARVTSRLRDASALVVLDACEHVLDEAARIASTLLAECPEVRILATSREALHVAGEVRIPVAPLGSAAVELFLERARAARPGFEPDAEAVALAAEIVRRVDGLPLAIELAAARVNVLGLAELVSILERRSALLRDSPASDPPAPRCKSSWSGATTSCTGTRRRCSSSLPFTAAARPSPSLAAVAATHGLNEATVAYLVSALVDKSIVSASFAGGVARYDLLDTVREYVLERLAESGGLAAARGAHAEYFAALAEEARGRAARAGMAALATPAGAGERQSLGCARVRPGGARPCGRESARDARVVLRARGARVRGTALPRARAVCHARRRAGRVADRAAGQPLLPRDRRARSRRCARGGRARAHARRVRGGAEAARARAADPRARSCAVRGRGTGRRDGAGCVRDARGGGGRLGRRGERPHPRDGRGARRRTSRPSPRWRRRSAVIRTRSSTTRSASRGCCSRRGWRSDAATARPQWTDTGARSSSRARIGFGDHAAFALSALGSNALANGDLREAEELQRQALATAEAADATWVAAHARVQLARIAAATGDADAAESLYRQVLEWSQLQRPHQARESLFVALAGSPATAALLGLAEIAEARGDTAAADELRARAGLALT